MTMQGGNEDQFSKKTTDPTKEIEKHSAPSNTAGAVGFANEHHGSGCSVVWLARLHGVQKVAGSSPAIPTIAFLFFLPH